MRLLLFKNIVEEFQVVERRFVLAFFDAADYFDRPVVDGSRHADLSSVLAHDAIDCLDLARFALFDILQHTCADKAVFFDCDGNYRKRDFLFDRVVVIQKFYDVFALNRLNMNAARAG